jgi:hypothetical protein
MRFWFDTEFYEDGRTIDLISIGIVAEDGRTYYAERTGASHIAHATPWLAENVAPHLSGIEVDRFRIREEIMAFVGENPEFWAYYADYDWVVLCQLYGTMMQLPKGWPMFCRDVKQLADSLGDPKLPPQLSQEHNALRDAEWTHDSWQFLQNLRAGRIPDLIPARSA